MGTEKTEISEERVNDIVQNSILSEKKGTVELSQFVPWQTTFSKLNADLEKGVLQEPLATKVKETAFVAYPNNHGGYEVQCVANSKNIPYLVLHDLKDPTTFVPKIPFPEQWRGLKGEKLQEISGIQDAVACHPTGFMCLVNSLDGARQMVETAREIEFTKAITEMGTKEAKIREAYRKTFGFESAAEDRAVENMKISIMDSIPGLESYIEDMDTQQSELEELENMVTQEMKIPDLPELETEEELEW